MHGLCRADNRTLKASLSQFCPEHLATLQFFVHSWLLVESAPNRAGGL